MHSTLKAISLYLPERILTNDELHRDFPDVRMKDLTRLTGVKQRHIAAEGETPVDMAEKAAQQLFMEHNISPSEIDFIILCTQWPDYITPSSSCILQDRLNIPHSAGSMDISQGCTGYIYGLATAKGLVESGSARNVLLITSEAITKSIHDQDVSNMAIFGDGAAACLVSGTEAIAGVDIGRFSFGTDGSGYEDIIIRYGGARFPLTRYTSENYKDKTGNVRNDTSFYMNGPAIFTFSTKVAPKLLEEVIEKNSMLFEDIDFFIFHQANRIILETILKKNKIPPERSIIFLEEVGNTVSSTIPIALYEALKQGRVKTGDKVFLGAFGVGLSWGGTVLRLGDWAIERLGD